MHIYKNNDDGLDCKEIILSLKDMERIILIIIVGCMVTLTITTLLIPGRMSRRIGKYETRINSLEDRISFLEKEIISSRRER